MRILEHDIRPASRFGADEHVVYIDTDSAPRVMFYGEDLVVEDLPIGTRCVYPRRPMAGLPNPGAAIRHALNHPEEMEPLHALLRSGMKVTVAVDDISLPLPPMQTPDIRQQVLEVVLQMLADYGVDDVHIIIATALHRRMTEAEVRRMVGKKIFDAHWPDTLYNFDACEEGGLVVLGHTSHGERVELCRRASESDLVIYVNLNLVPMDGGHKSVAVGLAGYEGLKAHHHPKAIVESRSLMDPPHSAVHQSVNRIGRLLEESVPVFHIETAINNRMFPGALSFLAKNEDEYTETDRLKLEGLRWVLQKTPRALRREIFMRTPSPYEMIAVHAGRADAVHAKILEKSYEQYCVGVDGQADILIMGMPYISPYNVNSSALNPLLVQVMALGYFFHFYRGNPLVKKDGVLIFTHPCSDAFDATHHPSYIEFFNRLLPETRDAYTLASKYQDEFAHNPTYVEMYRRGHAYHGAHPFYMWYWGQAGREWLRKVIVVGADNRTVPDLLGFQTAETLAEAIAMGRAEMGRGAQITFFHNAPIGICDVS
jgi:hypothetical protein